MCSSITLNPAASARRAAFTNWATHLRDLGGRHRARDRRSVVERQRARRQRLPPAGLGPESPVRQPRDRGRGLAARVRELDPGHRPLRRPRTRRLAPTLRPGRRTRCRYRPAEIRPSGETAVASVSDQARRRRRRGDPRWTRCQSLGTPSWHEYWHIGETNTRFRNVTSRSFRAENRALIVSPRPLRAAPRPLPPVARAALSLPQTRRGRLRFRAAPKRPTTTPERRRGGGSRAAL